MNTQTLSPRVDRNPSRVDAALLQRALDEREGSLKGLPEPLALPRRVTAGLEPYVPRPEKPWNRQRALYLLRRTMFGARKSDVNAVLASTPAEVVDDLLMERALPSPPGGWVNENYVYNPNNNNDAENRTRMQQIRDWWISLMLSNEFSIRERMVLFWHDHWATEAVDVYQPHYNYWFLDLFRRNFLGNFKQMVKDVTVAPCMLMYLNGNLNVKGRPNENYARELMELHTLGEGIGYTEEDIREAARALTGWTLKIVKAAVPNVSPAEYDPKLAEFVPSRHDATSKTFMGQTGTWKADDIVDIIFREREREVAMFICRKLYREFVYELADEQIVSQMATQLVSANWELRPVLSTLLKSEHFFETANIGAHISSPIEFYVGAIRTLEMQTTAYSSIYNTCSAMGMQLLQPPNVKGWPGYRSWITASRIANRWDATDKLLADSKKPPAQQVYKFDPVAFVTAVSSPNDVHAINSDLIELFFVLTLNQYQTEVLLDKLLNGWRDYEWNISNPLAVDRLRTHLQKLLRNNEAQLA